MEKVYLCVLWLINICYLKWRKKKISEKLWRSNLQHKNLQAMRLQIPFPSISDSRYLKFQNLQSSSGGCFHAPRVCVTRDKLDERRWFLTHEFEQSGRIISTIKLSEILSIVNMNEKGEFQMDYDEQWTNPKHRSAMALVATERLTRTLQKKKNID